MPRKKGKGRGGPPKSSEETQAQAQQQQTQQVEAQKQPQQADPRQQPQRVETHQQPRVDQRQQPQRVDPQQPLRVDPQRQQPQRVDQRQQPQQVDPRQQAPPQQLQQQQVQKPPIQAAATGARPKGPTAIISGTAGIQRQVHGLSLNEKESHDFPAQQIGTIGRRIQIVANHFKVDLPRGSVFHYDVDIRPIKKKKDGKDDKGQKKDDAPRVGVKPEGMARKLNSKLCRDVIELMLKTYRLKESHWPAYDGNKNLYTRKRLPINEPTQFEVNLLKVPGDVGSEEKFQVTIKPTEKEGTADCEVSLEPLHQLCEGRAISYPEEAVLALDIILRYGPTLRSVPVGRSFYMKPDSANEVIMEEGRAVWFGYHQSLRPGWKPLPRGFSTNFYLNIDKSTTAFLRPMNLVDFSLEVLHMRSKPVKFSDWEVQQLSRKVKGIQVQALHLKYPRKYKIVKIIKESASSKQFLMNDKPISVEKYFQSQYKKKLNFPNYPCVQVGDPQRGIFLPMEMCMVVDSQPSPGKLTPIQQSTMVGYTAIAPHKRFEEIGRYLTKTIDDSKDFLKEFEINISSNPVQLDARVLQPPAVEYKNNTKAPVRDGQWEMRGKCFINALTIQKWAILSLCRATEADMKIFISKLRKSGEDSGMHIHDTCVPPLVYDRIQTGSVRRILQELKQKFPDLELAVVILPKQSPLYKEVKHEGETSIGLLTQCVTDENLRKCREDRFSFRFLMNICQKINAKLGGTNVSLQRTDKPDIFKSPVIVIGADVTHPAPGMQDGYSIAACVGSVDSYPARYVTKIQIQQVHNEARAREERILDLASMIKDLLKDFYKATKYKPERIIFFRDGVSEGQFLQVRNYELAQIRQACTSLQADYKPKISFIVVQKRHHTRFAPQNFRDGLEKYSYNVPAGTTVDTDITHPSYFNFFLASHVALKGTARPAHYTVLWDDNDFSADTLQKFVFFLCHTYNRCTRSISVPPPVMYADLAAYRAKLYIDAKMEEVSSSSSADSDSSTMLREYMATIKTNDNIKNGMYYV